MASTTADTATTAACSLRELGQQHAAASRAEQGLATPAEDVTQLRRLVAILDYEHPERRTAPKPRYTASARRSHGTSNGAK